MLALWLGLALSSCASGKAVTKLYTNASFLNSGLCQTYACTLTSVSDGFYKYAVSDKRTGESLQLYLNDSKSSYNQVSAYLRKGSLKFNPSGFESKFLQDFFLWSSKVKVDPKADIFAAASLVEPDSVSFADLRQTRVGGLTLTLYVKSVPDASLDPARGRLVFGVMESKHFPPER